MLSRPLQQGRVGSVHSSFRTVFWVALSGIVRAWPKKDETSLTIFQMSFAVIAYALTLVGPAQDRVALPGGVMQSSSIFRG